MGMLESNASSTLHASADPRRDAARELESLVMKQLLAASGAFKGSDAAGASVWNDLLTEAVAQAVSTSGNGLGLASILERSLPAAAAAPGHGEVASVVAGAARLTSGFGERVDPINGERSFHSGLDLAAAEGTPIRAAAPGVVVHAGPRGGYGNAVEVAHADGTTTLYAHASDVSVTVGQRVDAGQTLGAVGHTGRSTGDHLHFELRERGHAVDPRRALQKYGARAEETDGVNPSKDGSP